MSVKKIEILRATRNGGWDRVWIKVFTETGYSRFQTRNKHDITEDEAVSTLFDNIVSYFDLEYLRSQVLQANNQLRENDLSGNSFGSTEIIVVPEEREAHQSCKENNDNDTTMQTSEEK